MAGWGQKRHVTVGPIFPQLADIFPLAVGLLARRHGISPHEISA
jgi:hypothetical protein